MELYEMSTKELLTLHNALADTPAGPKSFATKAKLIARIETIAADRNIDLASFEQAKGASEVQIPMQSQAEVAEAPGTSPDTNEAPTGKGIGHLARELLLDTTGYPHAVIAEMVNTRIEGARATTKSIRWYACRMRKEGIEVPERQRPVAERTNAVAEPEDSPETERV